MAYVQLKDLKPNDTFYSCKTRNEHVYAKEEFGIIFHIDMETGEIYKEANNGEGYVIINPETHVCLFQE
ncbi:MAG: hypothetical protein AAF620_01225 [Bacteroidota bacterium]